MDDSAFNLFCKDVEPNARIRASNGAITFENSTGGEFTVTENQIRAMLRKWRDKNDAIQKTITGHATYNQRGPWHYQEKPYRAVYMQHFNEPEFANINAIGRSQTKYFTAAVNKYVGFLLDNKNCKSSDVMLLDKASLEQALNVNARDASKQRSIATEQGAIEPNSDKSPKGLEEAFKAVCDFCAYYNQRSFLTTASAEAETLTKALLVLEEWLRVNFGEFAGQRFDVKVSRGSGKLPRVPWLVLLPPDQGVSNGIYVGICFGREGAGAIAGCAQSVSNPRPDFPAVFRTPSRPLEVDVDGGSPTTRYNDAFANPLEVLRDDFDEQALRIHVEKSLLLANELISQQAQGDLSEEDLERAGALLANDFEDALRGCGFVYSPGLPRSLVTALLAKRFAILTGNSGTGKTKLALLLAQWIHGDFSDGYALVPVGADWTDTRRVAGFLNPLREQVSGDAKSQTYEQTPILDLLQRARVDLRRPYFLVLDEMNLSHVERYFSDFLSTMESGEGFPLHSEADTVLTPDGQVVPARISIPPNFYVLGTVNVDETTYMFSPKVLDRANVLEFRPSAIELESFLASGAPAPTPISLAGPVAGPALVHLANKDWPVTAYAADEFEQRTVHQAITDLFELLGLSGFEFAFRTVHEIVRYLAVDAFLAGGQGLNDALDRQILQKLLPRLHGTRRRLEPTLAVLLAYAEGAPIDVCRRVIAGVADAYTPAGPDRFPLSAEKLRRMLEVLRRDQFVSFVC